MIKSRKGTYFFHCHGIEIHIKPGKDKKIEERIFVQFAKITTFVVVTLESTRRNMNSLTANVGAFDDESFATTPFNNVFVGLKPLVNLFVTRSRVVHHAKRVKNYIEMTLNRIDDFQRFSFTILFCRPL